MNKVFKKIWSARLGTYVAVAETARGHGKSAGVVGAVLVSALLAIPMQAQAVAANTLPTGGQVTSGVATINTTANNLTVIQNTQRAAINWQSFSIGSNGSVNFVQPNASSVTLNRVIGNEQSVIAGALHANGQVFLLNSSGVLFTSGAQVNVGGIVASTLNQSDADFMAARSTFERNGATGSVINLGSITTADGGYVALLGNQISNQGVISARLGTAVMAAGDKVSLNFNGNSLVGVTLDQGTLNALVENKQAIYSDGGRVVLTAVGLDEVMRTVVNNTGEIRAQTIAGKEGKIYLLGGMESNRIEVGGALNASAPTGGNGGLIETSAAKVKFAEGVQITTSAPQGSAGTWLIDPTDFTIAASGGDLTGSALGTLLSSNNITISTGSGANTSTTYFGATGVSGSIFVNDAVSWSSNQTLTLHADANIFINKPITSSGATGKLALEYGQGTVAAGNTANFFMGFDSVGGFAGQVNLAAGDNFSTKLGSDGQVVNYKVVTQLGSNTDWNSAGIYTLAGLGNGSNYAGNFVLGADITIAPITQGPSSSNWPSLQPIGNAATPFSGNFNGLGHTITGPTISCTECDNYGLFGKNTGKISNLLLSGARVDGVNNTGALVGWNLGSIDSVGVIASTVTGTGSNLGSIVGLMDAGSLTNSFAKSGSVTAGASSSAWSGHEIGGLVGYVSSPFTISLDNSFYDLSSTTVTVYSPTRVGANTDRSTQVTIGGLYNEGGGGVNQFSDWIANQRQALNPANYFSHSGTTYNINDANDLKEALAFSRMGGLLQFSMGNDITAPAGWHIPFLNVNVNGHGETILSLNNDQPYNSYQGLIGYLRSATVSNVGRSNAPVSGVVNGYMNVGGLVGAGYSGTLSTAYSSETVTGLGDNIGGLVGNVSSGSSVIAGHHSSGNVSGVSYVGGLAGYMLDGTSVSNSDSAGGTVTGAWVATGGLVGLAKAGASISNSNSSTAVNGRDLVGGLVGEDSGAVTNSFASGVVNATGSSVGGLSGGNTRFGGSIANSYATGSVTGAGNVGGLVGQNDATVTDSYATGTVSSGSGNYAGGLIGTVSFSGNLLRTHASGGVSGASYVGGLVGRLNSDANGSPTVTDSYSSGAVTGISGSSLYLGGLVGSWDDPSKVSNSFYNLDAVTITRNGSNVSSQVTLAGIYGSQYAAWQTGNRVALAVGNYFTADGTGKYQLGTAQNLKDWLAFTSDGSLAFALNASIDLSGLSGWHVPYLAASLSGNSKVLSNLANNQSWNNYQGLFGYLRGAVDSVGVYGSVAGYSNVGGLTGYHASGTVYNSYSAATVAGTSNVGGLAGQNGTSAALTDVYASGAVTGASNSSVGGLVGSNAGSVSNAYASGSITCTSCTAGGLLGANTGTINSSYWNQTSTGVSAGSLGTGLTDTAMTDITSFGSWSISATGGNSNTWRIYAGQSAPLLHSFLRDLNATATSGTRAYDGTSSALGVTYSETLDSHLLGTAAVSAASKNAGTRVISVSGIYSDQLGYDIANIDGALVITPKAITVSGMSSANKVYDGTTAAVVNGSAALQASEATGTGSSADGKAYTGDTVTLAGTATADFNSKNVANASTVSFAGLSLTGADASNYTLTPHATVSQSITPKATTISGTTAADKNSDGTTTATVTPGTLSGIVGGDSIPNVTASANFADAAVGIGKSVSVNYTLSDSNYSLAGETVVANISAANIPAGDSLAAPIANALITAPTFAPPVFNPGLPPASGSATTPPPNVVNPPSVVTAALGNDVPLMLVSAPGAGQPTQGVTLSQAFAMLNADEGAADGVKVIRVPTSRNSLEDIVNGGLRLPDGVEQELFVVQASVGDQ